MQKQSKEKELSFEDSFKKLEEILEKLNSSEYGLDQSLALFEEAEGLISNCSKKLNDAEKKVEMLIKTRNGELMLDAEQKPISQDFNPSSLTTNR